MMIYIYIYWYLMGSNCDLMVVNGDQLLFNSDLMRLMVI